MALFEYRAREPSGRGVTGQLEATSPNAAADRLFDMGLTPIEINETAARSSLQDWWERANSPRIKTNDLVFFARQMHTLLRASVPLIDALKGLLRSSTNPALAKVIQSLATSLEAGSDLTSAMRNHLRVFSHLFISMVQVGEVSGSLPEVFAEMAKYLDQENVIRARVKSAVRYPSFVLIAILSAMVAINVFVVPKFGAMFSKFGADLPFVTRLLLGSSNFFINYWYLVAMLVGAGFYTAQLYLKTPEGRRQWDRLKLRIPVVGSILFRATLARFARSLAITSRAGIPIVQGLPIATSALDNKFMEGRLERMREALEQGESVTKSAERTSLFPMLVVQMISVGEESGTIDQMVGQVADYYEREVTYAVDGLSASIEPILLVVVGGMMMVVAAAVFLPMWDMMNAVRGGK